MNARRTRALLVVLAVSAVCFSAAPAWALSGLVWAAGRNDLGQLGLGHNLPWPGFGDAFFPERVLMIDAGDAHSVALLVDGTVWTCGGNEWGQLGLDDQTDRNEFTQVPGLTDVVYVAAGGFTSMAVKSDGTLWVTGRNSWGELGLGDHGAGTDRSVFTQVTGLTGVTFVAGGAHHVFARTANGEVWVVGRNDEGQLGRGDNADLDEFQSVPDFAGARDFFLGTGFTLALRKNGAVAACGDNSEGQLGLGDTVPVSVPTDVPGLSKIISLGGGAFHSLALQQGGAVLACGRNSEGQLGLDDLLRRTSFTPVPLPFMGQAKIKAMGRGHGLHSILLSDVWEVYTTGLNDDGQLGMGDTDSRRSFTEIPGPVGVEGISAGAGHSLAMPHPGMITVTYPSDSGIVLERGRQVLIQWACDRLPAKTPLRAQLVCEDFDLPWYDLTTKGDSSKSGIKWTVGQWTSTVDPVYPDREDYRLCVSWLNGPIAGWSEEPFTIRTLDSIEITGPDAVGENGMAQYECVAHFTVGPDEEVTAGAKWKMKSKVARMDKRSPGLLTTLEVAEDTPCEITATYKRLKSVHAATKAITVTDLP
jgi:alpha-tubulin suppressor-like RCC1 family protein